VVRSVLGLSIGREALHAVVVERGAIRWAAEASYDGASELADAVARLAAEAGAPAHRVRIVLTRATWRSRRRVSSARMATAS
jgi:hypothetical protein